MRSSILILSAISALAISSCSTTTMEVNTNPVQGVDYSAYNTYEWAPLDRNARESMTDDDKQVRESFQSEVDSILDSRGYTKAGQGNADLLVYARGVTATGYKTVGKGAVSNDRIYSPYYQPNDNGSRWLGGAGYPERATQTSARFLISEPDTDKIVWQGQAVITIDDKRKQTTVLRDAKVVARKLMKGFPAKK